MLVLCVKCKQKQNAVLSHSSKPCINVGIA